MANVNNYYSGQGSLYSSKRETGTGKPLGFARVGNIPELTLDIEVDKYEHKESESGSRLLDLTMIKEKKGKFTFKLENLSLANLAEYLFGTSATVAGGTVTAEMVRIPKGAKELRFPLAHPGVSAVVVKDDTGTTSYALNTDYTIDAKNGVLILPAAGDIVADAAAAVGDYIEVSVGYTYASYTNMEAFTSASSPERYLRFEGLNTADGTSVIVDLFRCQFDPLTGYGLINDEVASVQVTGYLLADPFIVAPASPFFRQRNTA